MLNDNSGYSLASPHSMCTTTVMWPIKKKCSFFLVMASWTFPTHKKKDLRCYSTVKESRKRTPHLQTPPWTVENSNTLQCDGPWVSGQFRESFKVPFVSQERYPAQSQSPRQKLHLPQLLHHQGLTLLRRQRRPAAGLILGAHGFR